MSSNDEENPFVSIVSRKIRYLKKKLDKIHKCESQLTTEKALPLDNDQLLLLATKPSLEKALTDLESIKSQLEDVAKLVSSYLVTIFNLHKRNLCITLLLL
jgi:hypothetical protein